MASDERRRSELVTALGAVRARVSDACSAAGRDPRSVVVIAVTKTYPASDIAVLRELGVLDIGENRDQDARAKVAELGAPADLRWHFVGRVQSKKATSIATYAHAVHSVDRMALVTAFEKATVGRAEPLGMFVQVSLDGDPERGGAIGDEFLRIAEAIAATESLRLLGVMAVPPIEADPDQAFSELAALSATLCRNFGDAAAISGGMSADLESAIKHGATHVRVGTALLGRREGFFS